MRALVTGHEGFVGRHLVPKLVHAGYEVHGTEDIEGFLHSPLASERWDIVIHLAANIVNVNDRAKIGMRAYDDLELDAKMFRWVESNPPAKTMIAMSSCALDFPEDPYCIVKNTLESFAKCLHKQGVPVLILRPYSGYGPDQSFEYPFRAILSRARRREDPLVVWGGTQVRDWLHIDDLTSAVIHGIENFPRGVPIQIGTGVATDFFTLAKLIAETVGYSPRITGDPTKEASSPRRVADPSLAREHGWRSTITLEQGIQQSLSRRWGGKKAMALVRPSIASVLGQVSSKFTS
jgi:nucleoside-diphosphate-sugar epimerase